jgi:hypothetical protein
MKSMVETEKEPVGIELNQEKFREAEKKRSLKDLGFSECLKIAPRSAPYHPVQRKVRNPLLAIP